MPPAKRSTPTPKPSAKRRKPAARTLTVAVTGPTGEVGGAFVDALERTPQVGRILGMARRPFSPAERGWKKVEYRRGDILDRAAVDDLAQDYVRDGICATVEAARGKALTDLVTGNATIVTHVHFTAPAGARLLILLGSRPQVPPLLFLFRA